MGDIRELEVGFPVFSAEEIAASFTASAGSIEAQTLFVRGLALVRGIPLVSAPGGLEKSYRKLDLRDKQSILQKMAHGHRANKEAKEMLRMFAKDDIEELIVSQMPQFYSFELLEEMVSTDDRVTQGQVDTALTEVFGGGGTSQKTIDDAKGISAYLGLFNNHEWWKRMSEEGRLEMKERGRKLVWV